MKLIYFRVFLIPIELVIILLLSCEKPGSEPNQPAQSETVITYQGYDPGYVLTSSGDNLQDKLFYFLTILQKPEYQGITELPEMKALRLRYTTLLNEVSGQNSITKSKRNEFAINPTESNKLVTDFVNAYTSISLVKNLIGKELRPAGYWQMYSNSDDKVFLKMVIIQTVATIDTIISQYLVGTPAKYPDKDGPTADLFSNSYVQLFKDEISKIDKNNATMFYQPVATSLALLRINNRDESTRFEPLNYGENKAALSTLKNINWDNFPYTSLIVPGDSPNSPGDANYLSESAKNRVGYAVQAFNEKLAPVIIISGANVYPKGTPYFEAVEMKKYMIQKYSIPENVILIDPCARHTTTNLRNAVRVIIRNNVPIKNKALIIATVSHNDEIAGIDFYNRCFKELGYMPGTIGARMSPYRLEITPDNKSSLQLNAVDPLDP